jgi:hypothetical protein
MNEFLLIILLAGASLTATLAPIFFLYKYGIRDVQRHQEEDAMKVPLRSMDYDDDAPTYGSAYYNYALQYEALDQQGELAMAGTEG